MGRDKGRRANGSRRAGGTGRRPEVAQASGLMTLAETKLSMGEVEEAEKAASKALRILTCAASKGENDEIVTLPALNLLTEVKIELGDVDAARGLLKRAAELDPEGTIPAASGGGAEKFLWLAQLSEDGGQDSIDWFEKGVIVLRADIGRLDMQKDEIAYEEKQKKLAGALCGMAEIYMTDLSWESDAETECERLVTEAILAAPSSAETLQTLASIRISQGKVEEARQALTDSVEIWTELDPNEAAVPDYPTRISLARLLMEAEMEEVAIEVIERLVNEDDQSVEAWYLGGWCLYLLSRKTQNGNNTITNTDKIEATQKAALVSSREWLKQSLQLHDLLDYEDERLQAHAQELVADLDDKLGPVEAIDEAEEGVWESDSQGSSASAEESSEMDDTSIKNRMQDGNGEAFEMDET